MFAHQIDISLVLVQNNFSLSLAIFGALLPRAVNIKACVGVAFCYVAPGGPGHQNVKKTLFCEHATAEDHTCYWVPVACFLSKLGYLKLLLTARLDPRLVEASRTILVQWCFAVLYGDAATRKISSVCGLA